ncbi:MAG TPA: lmo0937 family membrane protein [Candidatus Paceibacterota bacterium]
MITAVTVVLVVLWLLGVATGVTLGGFVHILLVIAIAMTLVRLLAYHPNSNEEW